MSTRTFSTWIPAGTSNRQFLDAAEKDRKMLFMTKAECDQKTGWTDEHRRPIRKTVVVKIEND